MFPYKEEHFNYSDALDLKHPKTKSAAAEHNAKQTIINMTFDNVDDVAGFADAIFKGGKNKVYKVQPSFLLPRKADELFTDYSKDCVIM